MFKCISKETMLELAIKSGLKPSEGGLQPKHVDFVLVMCEELAKVNYDSMMLDMEFICNMAKKHAGWEDYIVGSDPSGNVDVHKMIKSQQEGVFYERFTHKIAAQLKAA